MKHIKNATICFSIIRELRSLLGVCLSITGPGSWKVAMVNTVPTESWRLTSRDAVHFLLAFLPLSFWGLVSELWNKDWKHEPASFQGQCLPKSGVREAPQRTSCVRVLWLVDDVFWMVLLYFCWYQLGFSCDLFPPQTCVEAWLTWWWCGEGALPLKGN